MTSRTVDPAAPLRAPGLGGTTRRELSAVTQRKTQPVILWAGVGLLFAAFMAYLAARWLASGPTRTPNGSTSAGSMQLRADIYQGLGLLATALTAWRFLWIPLRRDHRLSLDGKLVFAFLLIYWQDSLANYLAPTFTYNTLMLNFGSWDQYIPGWLAPNHRAFPEPVLTSLALYAWGILPGVILGNQVMRKIREKRPTMSNLGIILWGYAFFVVLDALMEPVFMWAFGSWTYPGAHPALTVFHGHYYQYPIYEGFFWGLTWTTFASVRFFRNDKGQTIVERGIDELKVGNKAKTFLSIMALSGVMNVIYIVTYNVPFAMIFGTHQAAYPKDITDRSYFSAYLCGPTAGIICPDRNVPVFKGSDGYVITPEGRLVPPKR